MEKGQLLDFRGKVDFTQAKKDLADFEKQLAKLGVAPAGGGTLKSFDIKPLTEYQKELLRIKEETLNLAKQKASAAAEAREQAAEERRIKNEQTAANRAASLATQTALREEARLKKEQIALEKLLAAEQAKIRKVPGTITSTTDFRAQFQNSTVRSESIINGERVARSQLNTELAKQAVLNRDLSLSTTTYFKTTTQAVEATNKVVLSKKELARLLAEEKYIQAQATAELKNRVREDLNAKGSTEQRRAALIRLQTTYDRLSATERNSPAGQRLEGIVSRLNTQVLTLEKNTGRAGRDVGNYGTKIINTFSSIAATLGVTFGVAAIVQFGKELFGVAKKAEGVELAFAKIGDRKDLEKLRASVKDTVSDLQLMELAVRADKFKIPMDVLAKGLEFSRQRAIDFGKDVDYMVDSFVNGIGRKSTLVLDNLGISASELQGEVRKTGDFVTAVGNIIDSEMAKGGIAVDTLADKSGRLATIWENLKKTAAGFFNSAKLDTEAIAEMTKAGQIDLNQSTYKTRLRLIESQSEKMKKLAQERVVQEQKIADLQGKYGTGTQVTIEEAKLRKIVERQLAEKNIYNSMVDQSKALSEQDRQTKGLLSLEELREKAQKKRTDASQIIIKGKSDEDQIRKLNREADELDKLANRFSEKTIKKEQSAFEKRAKLAADFSDKLAKQHREASQSAVQEQLEGDEKEIQSIKNKYEELRRLDNEFFAKNKNAVVKLDGKNVSRSQILGIRNSDQELEENAVYARTKAQQDKKEQKEAEDHYKKLLEDYMDYGQKMDKLKADWEKDDLLLVNNPKQRAQRLKVFERDRQDLIDSNSKKLEEYEKLFKGIDQLSEKSALRQLQFARKQFDKDVLSGKIVDPAEIAKIKAYFNQIENTIREGSGRALKELGAEVVNVANEIGAVNEEMGRFLNSLGSAVSRVGEIKAGWDSFKDFGAKGDSLGQLTAGLGIIGAGFSIFSTITKMFDRSAEREAEAAYSRDLQNKQTESLNKALERQVALLDKVYGTEKVKKYDEAVKQARKNEAEYAAQLTGKLALTDSNNKYIDAVIEKINRGEKLSFDEKNLKNLAEKNGFLKTLPQDIAALQKLMDEGRLDAGTELILKNLIKAKETADQLANSLNSDNIGSSLGQIADDFIATLTDGTQDFGKSFEDTIRTSILNGFKGKLIEQQLQAFYTQFADLSTGGLTAEEIETLRTAYTTAAEKAKKDIEDLEKATGINLTGKDADPSALKPNTLTAALNQPTGERLEGLWRGNFDLTKQLVTQGQATGLTMGEMYRSGLDRLAALERIAVSTEATAGHTARLEKIENSLVAIEANTKQVKSARD